MGNINDYIVENKKGVRETIKKPYLEKLAKESVKELFDLMITNKTGCLAKVEIKGYKTYVTNLGKQKFLQICATISDEMYDKDLLIDKTEKIVNFLLSNFELVQYEAVEQPSEQSKVKYEEPLYGPTLRGLKPETKKVLRVINDGNRLFDKEDIVRLQKVLFFAQEGYMQDWKKYNLAKENVRHEIMKYMADSSSAQTEEHECHNRIANNINKFVSASSFPIQFEESILAEEKVHE